MPIHGIEIYPVERFLSTDSLNNPGPDVWSVVALSDSENVLRQFQAP